MANIEGYPEDEWNRMVAESVEWEQSVSNQIAATVSYYRDLRGLTTTALARLCTDLGYPIKRTALTALLIGRRRTISIQELSILSKALRVPLLYLIYPIHSGEESLIAPGNGMHPLYARDRASSDRWGMALPVIENDPRYEERVADITRPMFQYTYAARSFAHENNQLARASHEIAAGTDEVHALFGDKLFPGTEFRAAKAALANLIEWSDELKSKGMIAPSLPEQFHFLEDGAPAVSELPVLESITPRVFQEGILPLFLYSVDSDEQFSLSPRKVLSFDFDDTEDRRWRAHERL